MQLLVYILSYPFLWVISILPFKILYLFSDFVFFLVYRIFGYRKKVVYENLKLVFPEKDEKEVKRIRYKFYAHLCDFFLETIKILAITKEELKKRYRVTNIEVLQKIEKEKSILVVFSHYANWEWSVVIN
ncbi:MAG: lipid A biosynthesis acyltransferase, partial [Saonia sp.]